jgi:hypothetical protein
VITQVINGRLSASKGSGSWRAHVVILRESSGRLVDQCDTNRVLWRVRR